jgi:hypothetical protein
MTCFVTASCALSLFASHCLLITNKSIQQQQTRPDEWQQEEEFWLLLISNERSQ